MKKYILLILLFFASSHCFSQRNSHYFYISRIIKVLYDSAHAGQFRGCIILDSSSKILKTHIGKVEIKSWNEVTNDSAIYFTNDDSGHFAITFTPGIYKYTISKPGYQPILIYGVHPTENNELYIKAVLEPGNGESAYVDENGTIKKYVPTNPSYIGKFYYGGYSDTTVAFLWGQIFLNTISLAGDTSIGFGKAFIKYRCIETGDTGNAQTDDASRFAIYFKDGHYDLTITSSGYKTVFIKNYNAYEAQESYLDAVLEAGNDESIFTITNDGQVVKEQ